MQALTTFLRHHFAEHLSDYHGNNVHHLIDIINKSSVLHRAVLPQSSLFSSLDSPYHLPLVVDLPTNHLTSATDLLHEPLQANDLSHHQPQSTGSLLSLPRTVDSPPRHLLSAESRQKDSSRWITTTERSKETIVTFSNPQVENKVAVYNNQQQISPPSARRAIDKRSVLINSKPQLHKNAVNFNNVGGNMQSKLTHNSSGDHSMITRGIVPQNNLLLHENINAKLSKNTLANDSISTNNRNTTMRTTNDSESIVHDLAQALKDDKLASTFLEKRNISNSLSELRNANISNNLRNISNSLRNVSNSLRNVSNSFNSLSELRNASSLRSRRLRSPAAINETNAGNQLNSTRNGDMYYSDYSSANRLLDIAHYLHYCSMCILAVFVLQV